MTFRPSKTSKQAKSNSFSNEGSSGFSWRSKAPRAPEISMFRKDVTASLVCETARWVPLYGAADLAGSLLSVTVSAGDVEARTFAVCGWADSAWAGGWCAKIPSSAGLQSRSGLCQSAHFCAERGRHDGLKSFSP